jgi:hypothetical protein
MMKFRLLILLCLGAVNGHSQSNVLHRFVVEHPTIDTLTDAYYGMQFEFTSKRTYFSANEFAEKGLFVRDSSKTAAIYFKHYDNKWYIKNFGGKWQLFYSDSKKTATPIITINGKPFRINWKKDEIFSGVKVAVFGMKPQGFVSNHQPDYFFDFRKGVVGLKTGDVTLIRSDFRPAIQKGQ